MWYYLAIKKGFDTLLRDFTMMIGFTSVSRILRQYIRRSMGGCKYGGSEGVRPETLEADIS